MPETIFVVQPDFPVAQGIDLRLLGVQFWWAMQLTTLGFQAMSGWPTLPHRSMRGPRAVGAGPAKLRRTLGFAKPTLSGIAETLRESGSRFALMTEFATPFQLTRATIYELKEGTMVIAASMSFAGDTDHVPATIHGVVVGCARHFGNLPYPGSWAEAFGTNEVGLVSKYLSVLGQHSSCEMGVPAEDADPVLRMAIAGIVGEMRAMIELFPALIGSLEKTESAPRGMLEAAVQAAAGYVKPSPPASWREMLVEYGAMRPRPVR